MVHPEPMRWLRRMLRQAMRYGDKPCQNSAKVAPRPTAPMDKRMVAEHSRRNIHDSARPRDLKLCYCLSKDSRIAGSGITPQIKRSVSGPVMEP
jgi:hypothetical protein